MDMRNNLFPAAIFFTALLFIFSPAGAVILEANGMGKISDINVSEKTITVYSEYQFATSYSGSTPLSEWIASDAGNVTGVVPDISAFDTFSVGDPVRFIILGGSGGTYLGIAKITELSGKAKVTDLTGDPEREVFKPLAGDYILKTSPVPNCAECLGTVCTASSADVTVIRSGETLTNSGLLPGESYEYTTQNPKDFDISVKFIKGESPADICKSTGSFGKMTGPQAVSVYEIHISPGVLPTAEETKQPSPSATEATPGFGFVTALFAALGTAFFIRRS